MKPFNIRLDGNNKGLAAKDKLSVPVHIVS